MPRALVVAAFLMLVVGGCAEDLDRFYRTYDEAVSDGAIARGWLPQWLPTTATEIHEWHDLDTNATFASFNYGSADPRAFLSTCEPASGDSVPKSMRLPEGESDRAFYRCLERTTFSDHGVEMRDAWAAIDRERRRAYFWR